MIKAGVDEGRFGEHYAGYTRAILPDAKDYTPELWRMCVKEAVGDGGVDDDEVVRRAAEWARENMGLEFKRLRKGGVIDRGIRVAIGLLLEEGPVRHTRRGELVGREAE